MKGDLKGIAYRVQVCGTSMVNRVMERLITIGLFSSLSHQNYINYIYFPKINSSFSYFKLLISDFPFYLLTSNFRHYFLSLQPFF